MTAVIITYLLIGLIFAAGLIPDIKLDDFDLGGFSAPTVKAAAFIFLILAWPKAILIFIRVARELSGSKQ